MPSYFHKKATKHGHHVRHRKTRYTDSDGEGEGVICASENNSNGTSFSFSGPAGSRHTAGALTIAGTVYSNQDSSGRGKSATGVRRMPARAQREIDDEAEADIVREDERQEVRESRTHASQRTTPSGRHADATSGFATSDLRRAAHGQTTNKVAANNRHGSSGRVKAFKHESESQLTYGVRDEGRKLFVSAPKDSRETDLFRQVAEMAQ